MREVHFQSIDLNLLRIFDALAEERSVTRAGERLGLTQSAVSHALNRLRYALEDELFLRGPDGMAPTPRAMEIWPELRRGLAQLQHALAPTDFEPAAADRTFHLAASTYVGELLLPRVVARVRQEAPQVQLSVHGVDNTLGEGLETGRIDLAIGAFGRTSDQFARERLFDERLVWVVRRGHPATEREMSTKAMEKLPLVLLSPRAGERAGGERSNRQIEPLALWDELASDQTPLGRGARQRIKVVVDNAHAALAIVAGSDLAALAPRRLAQSRSEDLGLTIVDVPVERAPTALETIWRADRSSHPALSWLRGVLREVSRAD
jgi:DNA-binding transcriptional LysR family regulator